MRASLFLTIGTILFPALAMAQNAPQIWSYSRPLNLSQSECIRQANNILRNDRWRSTWSDGNVTNGENNGFSAQIFCRANDRTVTFIVAGPSRNRSRSFVERLSSNNRLWDGNNNNNNLTQGPAFPNNPSQGFDEQFYLANNPDVADAVKRRTFASGLNHYQEFGRGEGRASRFDESYYLSRNADVASAVQRGEYRNGLQHWNQFGRFEGRPGGVGSLGQPSGQLAK